MASVLVIDDDEWILELLAGAIREAGHDVETSTSATDGVNIARHSQPDCIVCDLDLPDKDGYWVARTLRSETTHVSLAPFLFLSKHDEPKIRAQGFEVGADVFMTKPFKVDEVLAQIQALVAMAERLERAQAEPPVIVPPIDGSNLDDGAAIEGQVAQVSIANLLTVFEMEQRTGSFEVATAEHSAKLELAGGRAAFGAVDGVPTPPLDALRAMLGVEHGRFTLWPRPSESAPPDSQPIGELLVRARGPDPAAAPKSTRHAPPPPRTPEPARAPRPPDDAIEVEADLSSYRPPRG